jgi:hypothetical protein
VADAVRVGLDRFVLDALGSEALEERVYQSMLASRSDIGTPAKRCVIALRMYLL